MILGTGCDIIEIARIKEVLRKQGERFVERILTPSELVLFARFRDPAQFLAGRFTAKEALSKALGCGIGRDFSWQSASILNDASGKPYVDWHFDVKSGFGVATTHLSISHSATIAMAYAITVNQVIM